MVVSLLSITIFIINPDAAHQYTRKISDTVISEYLISSIYRV
jgi:hypothetical protein